MRLICPNCAAQYEIDAAVLPEKGRDVECSRCGQIWFQPRPQTEDGTNFDPQARPALNRSLSDSVLSVLREEAARELRAREEDRARARTEKARFEAESFSRTPVPPTPAAPALAPAHDAARSAFPFVDDRPRPQADPSGTAPFEAVQIDWPATTITDERIHEAPLAPKDERPEDEWAVATPALDMPEDRPAFAPTGTDWRDDRAQDEQALPPDTPVEDEPVATILFDETDDSRPALHDEEHHKAPRPPKAEIPAEAFAGLPNGPAGDAADTPLATERDPQPETPLLPVSVDSAPEDATHAAQHGGYARGFGLSVGLAAALAGFYLIAPSISGPGALGEFAAEYRSSVDQGRIWLSQKLGFLTGSDN